MLKFWKGAGVVCSVDKFGEVGDIWLGQGCTNRRHLGFYEKKPDEAGGS